MAKTLPQLLVSIAQDYPQNEAQLYKDHEGSFHPVTYRELLSDVSALSAALHQLGVQRGEPVGLISDNRREWLAADLAILALGAVDVPRGRDAMAHELTYILGFTETKVCFVENEEQLEKIVALQGNLPILQQLIVMDPHYEASASFKADRLEVLLLRELQARGRNFLQEQPNFFQREVELGISTDTATIIFTSGTTGEPKGVMLSHYNFLFQLEQLSQIIPFKKGERWLSVLPVWHSFERILQYVILSQASCIAYSKPIGKILMVDLQRVNPSWMGSVPRIWEAVKSGIYQNVKGKSKVAQVLFHFFVSVSSAHSHALNLIHNRLPQFKKRSRILDFMLGLIPALLLWPLRKLGDVLVFNSIKRRFGTSFRAGVSGGGSMPTEVDRFFKAIGITLLDGYGLTETAPVIGLRRLNHQVPETVAPLPNTEIRIVDEEGRDVPPGQKGVILVRGGQVMQGYYKRPDLTQAIIDKDGFLNTGDIGIWTYRGEYAIKGRAKDTIVLSGGENVEPVPIENRLRESPYIDQVMVVGQDQKYLSALIVPDTKQLELYLKESGIPYMTRSNVCTIPEVLELIGAQISELINAKNGFKSFERIIRFTLINRQFTIGRELSAKQEIMRHKVNELYQREIESLY